MTAKRKLWATQRDYVGAPVYKHRSEKAAYEWIRPQAKVWEPGPWTWNSPIIKVLVDERDGRGWRVNERVDLREWGEDS